MLNYESLKWYGNTGHFICSNRCRFHLCTEVGEYLVSTVGEFFVKPDDKEMTPVGSWIDDNYETKVFKWTKRCSCGCGHPEIDPRDLDCVRYATPKEANEGHMSMIEKYLKMTKTQESLNKYLVALDQRHYPYVMLANTLEEAQEYYDDCDSWDKTIYLCKILQKKAHIL